MIWPTRRDFPETEAQDMHRSMISNSSDFAFAASDGGVEVEFGTRQWWVNDKEITGQANAWIVQNGFGPWESWGDTERVLFKLTF
jgi:hypothetical protein